VAPEGSQRTIRLLVCEDSEDDALILRLALRRAGYELDDRRVETTDELRKALGEAPWDLVVADYSMPRLNGLEALRVVREHDPDLPFLLVSGSVGEGLAVDAMRAGANDYLMKDNLARLAPAVARELRESEVRRSRAATQRALKDSETRFLGALDAAPTAMLVVDPTGQIVLANAQAATVFDHPREELVGRRIETLIPDRFADIHQRHRDDFAQDPRTRRMGIGLDLAGRRRDGSEFPAEIGLSTFHVGDELFVIVAVHDITERMRMEEQLRQAQKMEAIGRLAGGIAHDFNNLLTAMNGYSDLILAELRADEPLRRDVAEIRSAGERAVGLTRQLLALGRRQVLSPRVIDLNELVRDLDTMLRRLIGEDIAYRTIPTSATCLVRADPGQIEQVILNLVVNARDAMPHGGRLTVETSIVERDQPQPGELDPLPAGAYAMIAVSDSGVGIDAPTRSRIFEPFFTTKESGKGSGLGLATAWGIVAQSGGTIWVYSEPGAGSTFKVYLPAVDEAEEPDAAPALADPSGGSETILVVEDDEQVRVLVGNVLQRRGYTVLEAPDPRSATDIAARHPGGIDLLIADVVMPGEGGAALARRLVESQPGLRVLFVSGYTAEAVVHHGVASPGTAFLEKPFTPDALARRVRQALDEPEGEPVLAAADRPARSP
jgi:PAS domain S-box-containing protein